MDDQTVQCRERWRKYQNDPLVKAAVEKLATALADVIVDDADVANSDPAFLRYLSYVEERMALALRMRIVNGIPVASFAEWAAREPRLAVAA